jgi:hypothetical protein
MIRASEMRGSGAIICEALGALRASNDVAPARSGADSSAHGGDRA